MRTVFVFFNLCAYWLLRCSFQLCFAWDTLNAGQKIIGSETNLVSAGKIFELGFFPSSTTGGSHRYLGIWYYHMQEGLEQPQKQTVVWVANRDNPVAVGSIGVFQIAEDGNLVVVDTSLNGKTYWSSNSSSDSKVKVSSNSSPKNRTVKLMDSGNLVLLDDDEDKEVKVWESFENPTDTFLPGMKMDGNMKLTSWRSGDDPRSGNFSFKMEQNEVNRFIISNRDQIYWESEEYGTTTKKFEINNGEVDDISLEVFKLLTNFSFSIPSNTRLFLDSTGVIEWVDNSLEGDSSVRWNQPKTNCLRYNFCGNFTSCNDNDYDYRPCKCLPGFYNDLFLDSSLPYKADCTRRKSAPCTRNDYAFLNLTMIKTGRPDIKSAAQYVENCTSMCLGMCPKCQAYSFAPFPIHYQRINPSNCWIWTHNLTTLKEDYTIWEHDRRLYVLVDKSDIGIFMHIMTKLETYFKIISLQLKTILSLFLLNLCFCISISTNTCERLILFTFTAPTPRTCETCGTNPVPYPLSTGPDCGDPTYFNFTCNTSTGQLSFTTNADNVNYRVIRVEPDLRKFTIYQEVKDNSFNRFCGEGSKGTGNLNVSSPYGLSSDKLCSKQVEVSWEPPSKEPICHNSADCHGWKQSSTCSKGNRCLCNANHHWSGQFLSCIQSKYHNNVV